MSRKINVLYQNKPCYDICIEDSFGALADALEPFALADRKVCIVTDSNVDPLYAAEVEDIVGAVSGECVRYVFPAGEESKTLDTVKEIYKFLIENHFNRKDLLIALGGGVVGDLTGYTAATYLRGIEFIQIPTTLLSQADSSIGGKTGVDFDSYKNMVGAFHMPKLVYTNVSVLRTLPDDQFSGGMGEVIKHGLILDKEYFDWIQTNRAKILAKDADTLKLLIQGSDFIKREVVEIDPTEQNERATLNFGHTLGHAIEKLKNFTMLHGHCVAVGALAAMNICKERGLVKQDEIDAYKALMEYFSIPTCVSGLNTEEVIVATKNDKKMEAGVIKFILLDRVGHAYIDRTVTKDEMERALATIFR